MQGCSYRGIKLTSYTLKIWEGLINRRLKKEASVSEQQSGFMPDRSTIDAHFALRQLMEKYKEFQKELSCMFIDLEKAYLRVPIVEVWNCLQMKEMDEKYIRLIRDIY